MIRHVVFDIGRVLVNFEPELAYLDLIPDAQERKAFLREVCSQDWILEQDRVQEWKPGEDRLIAQYFDKADLIRAFRKNWHTMVPSIIEGSVELLRALKAAQVDVTALTNFNGETFDSAVERFSFLTEFRGVTVSGKTGLLKPEPEIYAHHALSFNLDPAATLFIDDVAHNVHAAREAGWQAVQFHDPHSLRDDLQRNGLPV